MERKNFIISEEDWTELIRLSKVAQETPVIALSVADGLAGRDFASMARERVLQQWKTIAKKYGFDVDSVRPVDEDKRIVSAVSL
jgi:hypothetical protein